MTADNLNNMRVIPDLLAINEKVRPNKVAYRQFDDKSMNLDQRNLERIR